MGDFPNHHSFSKEIAESIGLEEAIIFEKIKSEDNKKISKKKLIEVLSYISKSKINESLHRLEKLNLIENNNESFSLKIIKTRPINTAKPIKDNSASFLRDKFSSKTTRNQKENYSNQFRVLKKQISLNNQKNSTRDDILKFLISEQKKINKKTFNRIKKLY